MNPRSARSGVPDGPIDLIAANPEPSDRGRVAWLHKVLCGSLALGFVLLVVAIVSADLFAQQATPPYPPQAYSHDGYPTQQAPYATQPAPPYTPQGEPGSPQAPPGYGQDSLPLDDAGEGAPPPPDAQDEYAPAQGLSPDQLEQLVAPVALYPDALLAQVLAASTYPDQVADAAQWRQAQMGAPPQQIADAANAQPWDPSVKALTAFPQVLAEMDQNLQWTTVADTDATARAWRACPPSMHVRSPMAEPALSMAVPRVIAQGGTIEGAKTGMAKTADTNPGDARRRDRAAISGRHRRPFPRKTIARMRRRLALPSDDPGLAAPPTGPTALACDPAARATARAVLADAPGSAALASATASSEDDLPEASRALRRNPGSPAGCADSAEATRRDPLAAVATSGLRR